MSKKVPVYLSESELQEVLRWADTTANTEDVCDRLVERLEAELATFEE